MWSIQLKLWPGGAEGHVLLAEREYEDEVSAREVWEPLGGDGLDDPFVAYLVNADEDHVEAVVLDRAQARALLLELAEPARVHVYSPASWHDSRGDAEAAKAEPNDWLQRIPSDDEDPDPRWAVLRLHSAFSHAEAARRALMDEPGHYVIVTRAMP